MVRVFAGMERRRERIQHELRGEEASNEPGNDRRPGPGQRRQKEEKNAVHTHEIAIADRTAAAQPGVREIDDEEKDLDDAGRKHEPLPRRPLARR